LSDHGITYQFTLLILVHKIVLSGFFRFYYNALITALVFVYTLLFCECIFAHYLMFQCCVQMFIIAAVGARSLLSCLNFYCIFKLFYKQINDWLID